MPQPANDERTEVTDVAIAVMARLRGRVDPRCRLYQCDGAEDAAG